MLLTFNSPDPEYKALRRANPEASAICAEGQHQHCSGRRRQYGCNGPIVVCNCRCHFRPCPHCGQAYNPKAPRA